MDVPQDSLGRRMERVALFPLTVWAVVAVTLKALGWIGISWTWVLWPLAFLLLFFGILYGVLRPWQVRRFSRNKQKRTK